MIFFRGGNYTARDMETLIANLSATYAHTLFEAMRALKADRFDIVRLLEARDEDILILMVMAGYDQSQMSHALAQLGLRMLAADRSRLLGREEEGILHWIMKNTSEEVLIRVIQTVPFEDYGEYDTLLKESHSPAVVDATLVRFDNLTGDFYYGASPEACRILFERGVYDATVLDNIAINAALAATAANEADSALSAEKVEEYRRRKEEYIKLLDEILQKGCESIRPELDEATWRDYLVTWESYDDWDFTVVGNAIADIIEKHGGTVISDLRGR